MTVKVLREMIELLFKLVHLHIAQIWFKLGFLREKLYKGFVKHTE